LHNLVVALDDARFAEDAVPRLDAAAAARGVAFAVEEPGDDVLAWIDAAFGASAWSSEARGARTLLVRRDGAVVGFATLAGGSLAYRFLRAWRADGERLVFGPFGLAAAERGSGLGTIVVRRAFAELRRRHGPQARVLVPAVADALRGFYARAADATVWETFDPAALPNARTTVLASGNGSNFQAVVDRAHRGELAIDVAALVVNRADAFALERARRAAIPATCVPWERGIESRAAYDARLLAAVAATEPDLVLLLGWMHLVAPPFLARFPDVLNVHPAYLPFDGSRDDVVVPDGTRIPAFRGAHAVRDALEAHAAWFGATAHRVSAEVDRGDVLVRVPLPMPPDATLGAAVAVLRPIEFAVVGAAIRRWNLERSTGV
jgi:folate-dependent phosphoribosylglycinamide formyltransferase PurN